MNASTKFYDCWHI